MTSVSQAVTFQLRTDDGGNTIIREGRRATYTRNVWVSNLSSLSSFHILSLEHGASGWLKHEGRRKQIFRSKVMHTFIRSP